MAKSKEVASGKRAIGYVRVSTAGQEERGSSLASQREKLREYADAKGLELLDIVAETASGGVRAGEESSVEHRPRLSSLIERAALGEYDVLIVTKLDRLSRDHASLVILERRLAKLGATVQSVSEEESNGDTALAEFIRGQVALVAQLERATILDRVRAGKASRRREGKHVGGTPPFGYQSVPSADGQGWTLEPVEETATIIRRIFQDAKAGDTPGRIATALNAENIPGPREQKPERKGAPWNRTAVRGIIENLAYTGERYGVKGAHPAIVTRRLFNAANAALASRAR